MIVLPERHKKIVDDILKSLPYFFYVFRSRAKGTEKKFSDLDLLVEGELSSSERLQLETQFEESDLPFKVDIVETSQIKPSFYNYIKDDLV